LLGDHLRDEFGVVREVGVHDYYVVAGAELQTVDVGGSEAELACARVEVDMWGVDFGELLGDGLGAVGRGVVDYY
jgi:hypothetical protein